VPRSGTKKSNLYNMVARLLEVRHALRQDLPGWFPPAPARRAQIAVPAFPELRFAGELQLAAEIECRETGIGKSAMGIAERPEKPTTVRAGRQIPLEASARPSSSGHSVNVPAIDRTRTASYFGR
jgi:hypothetical protein